MDKRNTLNEKNAQMQHERNTVADMDEARADADDDDEGGNSEDDHGEYEDAAGSSGDGTASRMRDGDGKNFKMGFEDWDIIGQGTSSLTTIGWPGST